MSHEQPRAVVLLSGGLDSATTLALAASRGFVCHALSFRYGQRHEHELSCARKLARALGAVRHDITTIDLAAFGGSALTDASIEVPKHHDVSEVAADIPVTYVPARNTIFLAFALARAETLDADDIFIGVNALDYSGYPDCRPAFIEAFEKTANLATRRSITGRQLRIHAPLIHLTKAQIIQRGIDLGVDFSLTSSCYDPSPEGLACSRCDACLLRLAGFSELGLSDPAVYA